MSKHSVPAGDVSGLLRRFAELRRKAAARTGRDFPIIVIREAVWTAFGSTGCYRPKGSRATWSTPRRSWAIDSNVDFVGSFDFLRYCFAVPPAQTRGLKHQFPIGA
jgi:hypothetical protein